MNPQYLLFISLCMTNPSLQKTGMAMQKWSINQIPGAGNRASKWGWIAVWILGLLFQFITVPLTFKALSLGNASTLGAFGGTGLVALALFSRFVIKETILRREIEGIFLIIVGTGVMGYFAKNVQSQVIHMNTARTTLFFVVYAAVLACAGLLLRKDLRRYGGAVLGGVAGSMAGIGIVMQKVVTFTAQQLDLSFRSWPSVREAIPVLAASPYTWLMLLGGIGGIVVAQFGYKYGKAIQVVPGFSSTIVTVPVIAGVVLLREPLPLPCWVGVAIVTFGVLVTTTAAKTPPNV